MVISTIRLVARPVVGVASAVAAVQSVSTSADTETLWRWLPPVVILGVGFALLKAFGKDQGRAFLKSDDGKEIIGQQAIAAMKSDAMKRDFAAAVTQMLSDRPFQLMLRDTITQLFRADVEKRDEYWDRVDVLDSRIGGMASALSNIEGFAETQEQMRLAMNSIVTTMGAVHTEIKRQGERMDGFIEAYNPETDGERRKMPRNSGGHSKQ